MHSGKYRDISFRELISAVSRGDIEAFNYFFGLYHYKVFSGFFRFTRSKEIAKDLVQSFFIDFWLNRERMAGVKYPGSYIRTTVKNMSLDTLRRKKMEAHHRELIALDTSIYHNPTQEIIDREDLQALVTQATAHLPQIKVQVFKMRNHEELNYQEIALALNISPKTAKTYYYDVTTFIRKYISKAKFTDHRIIPLILITVYCFETSSSILAA